ncbi:MAG: hypothetical protein GY861_03335 [bacterium]|nr:hypothetical protein [bacterium]
MRNPIIQAYADERGVSYKEAVKKLAITYKSMKEAFEEFGTTSTTRGSISTKLKE